MSRVLDMTKGNPTKLIIRLAVPLILTNIGQQLYAIIDAIVVGRGVGIEALAAVGATDWLCWLVLWPVQAMTQGFSVLVSQFFGAKNEKKLKKSISMSVTLCLGIGIVLTIVSTLLAGPLLSLLNTPYEIFANAKSYLTTIYLGTPIVLAYNMAAAFLRAFGNGRSPLFAMGVAGFINIVLDILFVIILDWGILGAAVATLIAQTCAFLYCAWVLRSVSAFSFMRKDWKPDAAILKRLCALGLPLALQHCVIVVGGVIVQMTVNGCGFIFVAGMTATNKLHGLLDCSAGAFGHAVSTFTGQNYGAGDWTRMKTGLQRALLLSVSFAILVTLCMFAFGRNIVSLFVSIEEENAVQVLNIAYDYLKIMSAFLVFAYVMQVYRSTLQGMGSVFAPTLAGFVEFFSRAGVALLLPGVLGDKGLFFTDASAWTFSALFMVISYYIHMAKARKNGIKKLVDE